MTPHAPPSQNGKTAEALIDEGLAAAQRLARLLEEEAERLRTRRLDGLQQLLEEKAGALQVLEQCEERRRELIDSVGVSMVDGGVATALDNMDSSGHLRKRWEDLLKAVGQCRSLNEHNGLVINKGLEQVDRALAVLRGTHGLTEPGGYGPKGIKPHRGPGQEISTA